MDGASGSRSGPQAATFDKSRVLDIKPLRTLVPMFPNSPNVPFVSSSPFGPYPSGISPFYPFSSPQGRENNGNEDGGFVSPPTAVPLRSFRAPQMGTGVPYSDISDGDIDMEMSGGKGRKKAASSQKRQKKAWEPSDLVKRLPSYIEGLSLGSAQRDDGNRETVNYVFSKFDSLRRRISQLDDSKEAHQGSSRRSDLKCGSILMTVGIRTNAKKRIGAVPGVEIGDIFYFRMEICVVGLHMPTMAGIDSMTIGDESGEDVAAVSIVSSGSYDDDADNEDFLIYTGQGGNHYSRDKDVSVTDQKLVRGNLGLDKSYRRGNEIRVIRGIRDPAGATPAAKIYVYDGLYSIEDSWIEKDKSGASSFKYKMIRLPGQPSAFGVWQRVNDWKANPSAREGLILPDITSGAESIPVSLVNDIDGDKGPSHFNYIASVKYPSSFSLCQPFGGCRCKGECSAGDSTCGCSRRNDGHYCPYTQNGFLVSKKPIVYECGSSCSCDPNCMNRVSQSGFRVHFEVFKTADKGWGLRSWDPIRAGTFICEYAGEAIEKSANHENDEQNDYLFDTGRTFDHSFKWNYDPELLLETNIDEEEHDDSLPPLVIDATEFGNVARFMNHSCSPNVLWQRIGYARNGGNVFPHVGFFAMRHIPPMTELTYDYGVSQSEQRRKRCLCGYSKCRGHFG